VLCIGFWVQEIEELPDCCTSKWAGFDVMVSLKIPPYLGLGSGGRSKNPGTAVAVGAGEVTVGAGDVAVGPGDMAVGAGDVAVGPGDMAVGAGDVAVGPGDMAVGAGDVAVGAGDVEVAGAVGVASSPQATAIPANRSSRGTAISTLELRSQRYFITSAS
jgi:ethanolamine utilization microcompartment shell protein EutS